MKKVAVIGKFCKGYEAADGQSIKTRIVAQEIQKAFGSENLCEIDTYGWKKHPVQLVLKSVSATWRYEHVIFMTDQGGIKIYPWLLTLANFHGRCKVHYVVIGGWLSRTIEQHKLLRFWLKKMHGIYVETNTMKVALEACGFSNIVLLPNCKPLSICSADEISVAMNEPLPLCTFSRVMKEKGIEDAVNAVAEINRRCGRKVFTLDIYGQVDPGQKEWFEYLAKSFPEEVHYGGIIPYQQSTQVLRHYFTLLFPTRLYVVEGVPGTIIDAYASGLPIIASKWANFDDVLDDETCLSYAFEDEDGLVACLGKVAQNPSIMQTKRNACLQRAHVYTPDRVMKILIDHLN